MGFEAGGYAEKLGNRYEGRWVVRRMIGVLADQSRSITLEAVGDDEQGVDLWLETSEGHREAQQCKAENKARSQWTMADLLSEKVLENLCFQIERNSRHRFTFVSSVPCPLLRDLSRRARDSSGSARDFYEEQIRSTGTKSQGVYEKAFHDFCRALKLDWEQPNDLDRAHTLLSKSDFHLFSADAQGQLDLEALVSMHVAGDAGLVVAALADFAVDRLRKTLTADEIAHHLVRKGFQLRNLIQDGRVQPCIQELRDTFFSSFGGQLAGGKLIQRAQAKSVIEDLKSVSSDIVVVHGRAGFGKSGILLEVATNLQELGIPILPLRLDRQVLTGSCRQFGQSLGLPDSPALCLSQLAGERTGVMIIDQLDALRWTSEHSAESWRVCTDLIRQATRQGNIRIVLACRTFDLEHDPQFASWASTNQIKKFEVGDLDERTIKDLAGPDIAKLSPRQLTLLASVQNMSMWLTIRETGGTLASFTSNAELMRKFWENRLQELARRGVTQLETQQLLADVLDFFERKGTLSCPKRLLQPYPVAARELASLNVIRVTGNSVSFCHQSYADYLVALKVLDEITRGNQSIVDWLGEPKRQTLFRREQLRLILSLLRDEDRSCYLKSLSSLITGPSIRFHLKHLCLQLLGQVLDPDKDEVELVIELLESPEWHDHVMSQVLWNHPAWMAIESVLAVIRGWLTSGHPQKRWEALWLMRSVIEQCGEHVAALIEPFVDRENDDWPAHIDQLLWHSVEKDSAALFEIRLRCVRKGRAFEYIDWQKFVDAHPGRCLPLIEARVRGLLQPKIDADDHPARTGSHRSSDLELRKPDEMKALESLAQSRAEEVWRFLLPLIEEVFSNDGSIPAASGHNRGIRQTRRGRRFGFLNTLGRLLIVAGHVLIRDNFSQFVTSLQRLSRIRAKFAQRVALEVICGGGPGTADWALKWLLASPLRLELGKKSTVHQMMPARRLIKKFALHCSEETFGQLESFLLSFHAKSEKQSFQARHWEIQAGYLKDYDQPNLAGMAQFFLLSALPRKRMSLDAVRERGVAVRKFKNHFPGRFDRRPRSCGGSVVSPIPRDRLHLVSDDVWLRIMQKYRSDRDQRDWKQVDADHIAEYNAEWFARDLGQMAKRQPGRMARLALKIRRDTSPRYLTEIMRAFELTSAPDSATSSEAAAWQPVTAPEIEAVFSHAKALGHTGLEHSFCTIVRQRPSAGWSAQARDEISRLAITHPAPNAEDLIVVKSWETRDVGDLENVAINYVRGPAALAVSRLIARDAKVDTAFEPAIQSLIQDFHPGVRVAAASICWAMSEFDSTRAVRCFLDLCDGGDDRILPSHWAVNFVNAIQKEHLCAIEPLIHRMIASPILEVRRHGAARAFFIWLLTDNLCDLVDQLLVGSVEARRGIADVAADNALHSRRGDKSRTVLKQLLNDDDEEVRERARSVFHQVDVLANAEMRSVVTEYLKSAAFSDEPTALIHALEEHKGLMLDFQDALDTISRALSELAADTRGIGSRLNYEAEKMPLLLLRLYEQAQGKNLCDVQDHCLDAWDQLLRDRVGTARGLLEQLDK